MRCPSLSHALLASALLLSPAAARAEGAAPPPAAPSKSAAAAPRPKVAGKPAQRATRKAKRSAATIAPDTPIATYPAFRLLEDGTTRISVEVSRKVTVTEHKAQGRAVYSLAGVAASGNNTLLPLPTGFFRTPVDRVELVEQNGGADLVIELREAVQPTYRVLDTPRGIVIQVDLPRPAGAAAPPSPDAAARTGETKRLEPSAAPTDD
jgi:hypothetical protein